jgi:membrane protein YdbS with pleckstrin-like domain
MNAPQGDNPYQQPAVAGNPPHGPGGRPEMLPPGQSVPGGPGQYGHVPGPSGGEPANGSADQAFAPPPGTQWATVSPRLALHRRISVLLGGAAVAAVGGLAVWWTGGLVIAVVWVVAVAISCGLGWIVAELSQRSLGYVERPDDLLVTHGVLVRRLVVVPYGRMQYVDVTAGLLEQLLGIATVRLHTAAAATDARIPGLPAAEAALLRDRLTQKGENRAIGL